MLYFSIVSYGASVLRKFTSLLYRFVRRCKCSTPLCMTSSLYYPIRKVCTSKYNFHLLILVFFCSLLLQCQEVARTPIPPQHNSIDTASYQTFVAKLEQAHQESDYYTVAFQLANLKASNDDIYYYLEQAVQKQENACIEIYRIKYLGEQGWYRHLHRYDTLRFAAVFQSCLARNGQNDYEKFRQNERIEEDMRKSTLPELDSSQFNQELIAQLDLINRDDQRLRRQMNELGVTETQKDSLWLLQASLDSINILRVDTLLATYGYPKVEEIGYKHKNTIFLVVHHQGSIAVRRKYFALIREHLSNGQIELFERRNENILNSAIDY